MDIADVENTATTVRMLGGNCSVQMVVPPMSSTKSPTGNANRVYLTEISRHPVTKQVVPLRTGVRK